MNEALNAALNEALKHKVYTAMQNAVDNGYTFMGMTDEDVAADLLNYSSDMEGYVVGDVVSYVKQFCWQREIDRVTAAIAEGDFEKAQDYLDLWVVDIKIYIESFLPTNMLIELNHYRKTK